MITLDDLTLEGEPTGPPTSPPTARREAPKGAELSQYMRWGLAMLSLGAAGVHDQPPVALGQGAGEGEAEPARRSGDDASGHVAHRRAGPVAAASGNWS